MPLWSAQDACVGRTAAIAGVRRGAATVGAAQGDSRSGWNDRVKSSCGLDQSCVSLLKRLSQGRASRPQRACARCPAQLARDAVAQMAGKVSCAAGRAGFGSSIGVDLAAYRAWRTWWLAGDLLFGMIHHSQEAHHLAHRCRPLRWLPPPCVATRRCAMVIVPASKWQSANKVISPCPCRQLSVEDKKDKRRKQEAQQSYPPPLQVPFQPGSQQPPPAQHPAWQQPQQPASQPTGRQLQRQQEKEAAKAAAKAAAAGRPKQRPPKGPCGTPCEPPTGGTVTPLPLSTALVKNRPPWNTRYLGPTSLAQLWSGGVDAVRVSYPAGSGPPSSRLRGGIQLGGAPPCLPARDCLLRFDFCVPPDFDWTRGGKLGGGLQVGGRAPAQEHPTPLYICTPSAVQMSRGCAPLLQLILRLHCAPCNASDLARSSPAQLPRRDTCRWAAAPPLATVTRPPRPLPASPGAPTAPSCTMPTQWRAPSRRQSMPRWPSWARAAATTCSPGPFRWGLAGLGG